MREINITRIGEPGDFDHLIKGTPQPDHFTKMITEDCTLILDGKPIGIYINLREDQVAQMREVVKSTKFDKSHRTGGLPTASSVFGSMPRVAVRNDFCRFTKRSLVETDNLQTAFNFSSFIAELYSKHLPDAYEYNVEQVQSNVNGDWLLTEAPFTTCNFNVNHAIKYHRDTGNFRNVYSNVLILKEGMDGGQLVFPEYGFALAQADRALAIFDGQKHIHGCLPVAQTEEGGYRASIVYYALETMKHCYPYQEELERAKTTRTSREERRAQNRNPHDK